MRAIVRVLVLSLAVGATAPLLAQFCGGSNHVVWPSANPVWDFCWVSPDQSSGPDGSGLELRHVFYRGKRVFWRANMPVLNVLYDPNGCGPTYRDWMNSLAGFDDATSPPTTTCDTPGSDPGTFLGVDVESFADRVVLTTQTQAGWYRYVQTITFHADGRIVPLLGFTAVTHPCVDKPHTHHGYYRFDFDINGPSSDHIRQRKKFLWLTWWSKQSSEGTRNRASGRRWRVVDSSGSAYEIVPGSHDGNSPDVWAGSDVWLLRYRGNESDDGGRTSGAMADAQHIDPFVNGESINGTDVVLWYRVGHRHGAGLACTLVGPTLMPVEW
jgi:hypothetical protein